MARAGDVIQRRGAEARRVAAGRFGARWIRGRGAIDVLDRESFLIVALAACGTFQALTLRALIESDSWLTLLAGRLEARSGLPHQDHLASMTAGTRWVDQQWLAHLSFYELWNAGGWGLALVTVLALFMSALVVSAIAARRAGASSLAVALVVIPTFLVAYPNTVLRAQVPAYLLFALVLLLLLDDARGLPRRRVFLVFPLLVLWANIHGSAVLGAGLVTTRGLLYAIERLRERKHARQWLPRAAALTILPWPLLLASPYGFELPSYYSDVLFNSSFGRFVTEWNPSTLPDQPIFYCFALAALWVVARRGSSTPAFAQVVLVASALAGMAAVRNIVWFGLAALAILPRALDELWQPEPAPRRRALNVAVALAGAGVLAVSLAVALARDDSWYTRTYPQQAAGRVAAAAAADPSIRVFANERYADWILFEHPELFGRIAYDARFELLSEQQLSAIAAFRAQRGPAWRRAANGYRILVLDPVRERAAARTLRSEPGVWTIIARPQVVVLGRSPKAAR
jgi:hypothetical protein